MDLTIFSYLLIILLAQLATAWVFYKDERPFVLLICFLLNLFTWSAMMLLDSVVSLHIAILLAGVFLLQATGYRIFMKSSWQKAFLVSLVGNIASLALAFLFQKIIR